MAGKKSKKRDGSWIWWVLGALACAGLGVAVVLVTIAFENFRTFGCRSKMAEAKANLSGLWVAERSFFGEYGHYSTDLVAVNWWPDDSPRYVYGFAAESREGEAELAKQIPGYDPSRRATDHPGVVGSPPRFSTAKMPRAALPADARVSREAFLAAAAGNLDDDPTLDVWTMDHEKKLVNVVNDCVE